MAMSPRNSQAARTRNPSRDKVAKSGVTAQFVLHVLRHWWKLVVPTGVLLAAVNSALVLHFFQRQYEAVAWLRIDDKPTHLSYESTHEDRPQSFANTQIELLRSPPVLQPVARSAEVAAFLETVAPQAPLPWLAKWLSVKSVGQSELYKVSLATPDAQLSAQIVNSILDSYFKLRSEDESERVGRLITLLEEEKQRRAREVALLRDGLKEADAKTPVDAGDASPLAADAGRRQPLAELQAKLINAEVERQVLEVRLRAAEEAGTSSAPAASDGIAERAVETDAEVVKLKSVLAGKRMKLHDIAARSADGENNPFYRQIQSEVLEDEQKLEQLAKTKAKSIRAELERTEGSKRADEVARLKADLEARRVAEKLLRQRFEALSEGQVEAAAKQNELARAEKAFDLIADRVAKLRTEQHAPGRVSLLERAEVPPQPVERLPLKQLVLVSLAGLFAPGLLVVGWEHLARRINAPECLEERSTLPVLAEVPRLPSQTAAGGTLPRNAQQPMRMFEESIDALATSLLLAGDRGEIKVVAITSAMANEGKTSVASRLAVSIARASGEPTLLIDGDMRSPDVHHHFHVDNEPGLAEVLKGARAANEAILADAEQRFHVLPAGRLSGNPHSLLGAGRLDSLLEDLRARYRYIVLDTPPVLAAGETLLLSKAADACLICAMQDASRMSQVEKARARLESVGCRIEGIVLNGVPVRHYAYRYGSYAYANT